MTVVADPQQAPTGLPASADGAEAGAVSVGKSPREVVHDLRQPLAAVGALVGAAETNPHVPEEVRCQLAQIKGELRLMAQLCRLLVEEVPEEPGVVRLDHLVRDAGASVSLTYGLAVEVQAESVQLLGRELDLRRAVQNLLENACRAAGRGGTVCVRVRKDGSLVRIEVDDNGPGFGDGPRGSSSLGLNIVQRAASAHGGSAEIGGSELGGVSVTIILPDGSPGGDGEVAGATIDLIAKSSERHSRSV